MQKAIEHKRKPGSWRQRLVKTHVAVAKTSMQRLLQAPVASATTTLVIAIALFLPGLLYLINTNLTTSLGQAADNAAISVYLNEGLPVAQEIEVSEYLQSLNSTESIEFISSRQALEEFSQRSGMADLLSSLPDNPLPATVILTPTPAALENIDALLLELESIDSVTMVQLDRLWLQRLQAMADFIAVLGRALLLLVVLGLVAIVGNTIRLAVEQRRQEILVTKLIGASNSYIARPFLYTGLFLGLGGGLLACLLVALLGFNLASSIDTLSSLYASDWRLSGLGVLENLTLTAIGAGIGWISAFLASYRNIATIEP